MNIKRRTIMTWVMTLCLLPSVVAFAQDTTKTKGMIISRTGDTLILNSPDGKTTIVMDDSTKVQHPKGLGIRKQQVEPAVLIPGLKVTVVGTPDSQNRMLAKSITFDTADLETAEMIQAGLHPTAEQVAENTAQLEGHKAALASHEQNINANRQSIMANQQATAANTQTIQQNTKDIEDTTNRFTQLTEYDVKGDATVNFATGSSRLSPDAQATLVKLAQSATGITGYIIEVKGYADSRGSAVMNTRLSQERADAVVALLVQQGGIPIRHITAPGAYGETNAVASNETAAGRAENRRAEVKILVNKGIAGN